MVYIFTGTFFITLSAICNLNTCDYFVKLQSYNHNVIIFLLGCINAFFVFILFMTSVCLIYLRNISLIKYNVYKKYINKLIAPKKICYKNNALENKKYP